MRVAVVGAGIAGLTVAAALSRRGIDCTVYERAERLAEVGAGLQLTPNATRLLLRLGLADALPAVAVRPTALEIRRWRDGTVISRTELGAAIEARFGAPYHTIHRARLQQALLSLASDRVQLGRQCIGLTEEPGRVRLSFVDGTVEADLVVGADGIHSAVRRSLANDEPRFTGLTVYRGLSDDIDHRVRIWLGPGRHFVAYPIGDRMSFVAAAPLDGYADWHEDVRALLASAERVTRWALYERPALARWCTRRVVLVGDAAHAMLPLGAQGANQAIEDAVVLANCLGADVSASLREYERLRVPRLARVTEMVRSHVRDHHLPDGPAQRARDRALRHPHNDWLYGYDAEEQWVESR